MLEGSGSQVTGIFVGFFTGLGALFVDALKHLIGHVDFTAHFEDRRDLTITFQSQRERSNGARLRRDIIAAPPVAACGG